MSDDKNHGAEFDNKDHFDDSAPTSFHVKPSSKCDMAEQNESVESNGIEHPVDAALGEEHVRELLNILIDDESVDSKTKIECAQAKRRKKLALTNKRVRKHEREMLLESWDKHKKIFDQYLDAKKVSEDDRKCKTFNELCKILIPSKSLYEERAEFYKARMEFDESLDQYFQRLTDLSSNCQFGERRNAIIADKFILSKSSIYYAFCEEDQKEVQGKRALKIAKQNFDKRVVPQYSFDDFLERSYRSRGFVSRVNKKSTKVPPHLAEIIRNEIMEKDLSVEWNDIAGLEFPKSIIKESIVWPMLRPDIFTGLRKLPKAILLFGPPGTGKTMIAKCIAAQSKSTFFYVSASTMASKWYGESEQLVRALFTVAAEHQPSVIFFDEVDSLLTKRKSEEYEINRRVKTEFMIHLDGAATKDDSRVLFIGATNRPQDLDEAARRRFVKRLYVPLPDLPARQQLLQILLKNHRCNLTDRDFNEIASMTNEFSGADIKWLCQDAAMEPLRSIPGDGIKDIQVADIRPLEMYDFVTSLKRIRPSVSNADLTALVEWDRLYGSNSERKGSDNVHFMYS